MRPLRDFHSKIQPYITGCPEPTLEVALVDAAIDFCERTQVIHQQLPPTPTFNGQLSMEVDLPAEQRVSAVRSVWVDGRKIHPVMGENVPGPIDATGRPNWYWGRRDDSLFELVLRPIPDGAYQVAIDVSYCPVRGATTLENDLFDLWIDAIRAGTLARLYSIPGQIFSDMQMATVTAAGFRLAIAEARRAADNTRVKGSHAVRPQRFA